MKRNMMQKKPHTHPCTRDEALSALKTEMNSCVNLSQIVALANQHQRIFQVNKCFRALAEQLSLQKLLFYYCISTTYPIWTMTIFCDVGGGSVLCSLRKSFPICFLTTTKCSVYQLFGGCLRCGGKTVSVCRSINGCQAERT